MGMVLIMMFVLSTLGVATLSLAVSAYHVQISDIGVKSAFYVADSAMDQAHGLIGAQIKTAIIAGNEAVGIKVQEEIKAHSNDWLKEDGTVDGAYLARQLTTPPYIKTMQDAYVKNMVDNTLVISDKLTNPNSYTKISENIPNTISIGRITSFDERDTTKNMIIPLQFKIIDTHGQQAVTQQVAADFNIKVPTKIIGYTTKSNSTLIQNQPLWRTALASYKNIDLSGDFSSSQTGITVTGDVFAAGTIPTDLKDLASFGGITAGNSTNNNNTKVTINGNAYSDANVQVKSDITSLSGGTNLTVTKSVYCDNLVLQKDSINSNLEVGEDAYTKDDIEINGVGSNLWIKGYYNGYSGGETGHDQSSSIVINSTDINQLNGSKLKVDKGSFMNGTVYINSGNKNTGEPDYQTGESLSVDSNYRAYGYLPLDDKNKYIFRKVGNSLMLIDKLNNQAQEPLTVLEKASHFYKVSLEGIKDFLNTGYGKSSIILGGQVISTGAYINDGEIKQSTSGIDSLATKQIESQKAVLDNVTKNFGHWDVINNTAVYPLGDRANLDSDLFSKSDDLTNPKEVLVTSKDYDVALIGEGGDTSGLPAGTIQIKVPSLDGLSGLVLTTKQVFIRGKVDFKGSIIAGDNITVEDSNIKSFTADEQLVRRIIATKGLDGLFKPPEGTTPSLINFEAVGGVPGPAINAYNELIMLKNWTKILVN